MSSEAAKRPWLAALLALAITGLGHLYLRRWGRALAWLFLVAFTVIVFVPDDGLTEATLFELAPMVLIAAMSVVDAYVLAREQNRRVAIEAEEECPSCGREVEDGVDFCWYCAEPLAADASEESTPR